jgi:NAD(P)-dependent dehydrogenase (short-subunit alcohol dehydrogenase family)
MPVPSRDLTAATRPLADRTVIVTGGASGLGAAIADVVGSAGGRPIVFDRRPPTGEFEYTEVDLADTAATGDAVRSAAERFGGLYAVVTCAGVDLPAPLEVLPAEQWEWIVRVNLFGTAAVVRAAVPWLEATSGRVVTVASTLGHRVAGDASAYCASKWGVVGFSRAIAEEYKGRIGVTLLTPGGMATAFFDERDEQYRPGPDARLCDPHDVAEAALFALTRPPGCEVKELVVAGPTEVSWP